MTITRLTDRWIQSTAPSRQQRLDYADALCPGLHLRVTQNGVKTFSAMLRVNSRLQRRTIGRFPVCSLAQARELTRQMQRDAAVGIDPRALRIRDKTALTFDALVMTYVERHLKPNLRSYRDVEASLRHSSLKHLLTRRADSITKREIIEAIDGVVSAGTPHAAVSILRRLKMLFNWSVDRDLLSVNPCERVRPPAKTTERDRVLTNTEIAAVWSASFRLPDPYGQMYRIFMLTGQRRSEVSTMRWNEITNDLWVIPREKVKKDRPHAVPLVLSAQQTIGSMPCFDPEGFVFTTTGGRSASSNFAKVKIDIDQLSGVKGWTIHDIRRTVRSKLSELRVPREVARKILNHEDGKVDRIYNRHEYLDEKREALTAWEAHLLSILSISGDTGFLETAPTAEMYPRDPISVR